MYWMSRNQNPQAARNRSKLYVTWKLSSCMCSNSSYICRLQEQIRDVLKEVVSYGRFRCLLVDFSGFCEVVRQSSAWDS